MSELKSKSFAEQLNGSLSQAQCLQGGVVWVENNPDPGNKNNKDEQKALKGAKDTLKRRAKVIGKAIQAAKITGNKEIYNDDIVKTFEELKNICDSF